MNDTIPFLGWAIKPIHLTAVYYAIWLFFGFFGTGFGIMAGWFHSRGNRQMDRYVESSCEISEPDRHGYRTLAIRNADMVFRLKTSFAERMYANGSFTQRINAIGSAGGL